jgi:glycosyltransferase involved in cell wall biosynthesis
MGRNVRRTCLVNNYNYARFVEESVSSALEQTVPFDEIIVVDDGSHDDSVSKLRGRFGRRDNLTIVEKQNEGQLSCLNEGFRRSTGDLIFFLDADDAYDTRYVEEVSEVYERNPECDFVFTALKKFGNETGNVATWHSSGDLGSSVILTLALGKFVGAPTSAVSVRRRTLGRVLPMPLLEDWRTRADECLVVGCSLAGARKYCLDQPLVRYRVHGENRHFGRSLDAGERYRYALRHDRMVNYLLRHLGHDSRRLMELTSQEFLTIAKPHRKDLHRYLRIVAGSRVRLSRKLRMIVTMLRHYRSGSSTSDAKALQRSVSN